MKKLYIDCGSHKGTTIKAFLNKHKGYDVIAIDPTPELFKYYPKGVKAIAAAAWIFNGTINFYNTKSKAESAAGTLFRRKKTGKLDKKHPREVPCIDLCSLIQNADYEYIVLKMNIEGAEYTILSKMLCDETIKKINELYVKWHWKKIKGMKDLHNNIVPKLKKIKNLTVHEHNVDENCRCTKK